jgi:hypothetical protein
MLVNYIVTTQPCVKYLKMLKKYIAILVKLCRILRASTKENKVLGSSPRTVVF